MQEHDKLTETVKKVLHGARGSGNAIRLGKILSCVHTFGMFAGVTERHIRGAIEELRDDGELICNLASGDGYYLASTPVEYLDFRRFYTAYARTIEARARIMDKAADRLWGSASRQAELLSS